MEQVLELQRTAGNQAVLRPAAGAGVPPIQRAFTTFPIVFVGNNPTIVSDLVRQS